MRETSKTGKGHSRFRQNQGSLPQAQSDMSGFRLQGGYHLDTEGALQAHLGSCDKGREGVQSGQKALSCRENFWPVEQLSEAQQRLRTFA